MDAATLSDTEGSAVTAASQAAYAAMAAADRFSVRDETTDDWRPFLSWELAEQAMAEAKARCTASFRARVALTAPFIAAGPTAETIALTFSRGIEAAVQKCPTIPADIVEACRAEEAAKSHRQTVWTRAVMTPAPVYALTTKLRIITSEMDDVFDPEKESGFIIERQDEYPLAMAFLGLHRDLAGAVQACAFPDRTAWNGALSALAAAENDWRFYEARGEAEMEVINAGTPPEILGYGVHQRRVTRWVSVRQLFEDVTLTPDDRDRLEPTVAAWDAERTRLIKEKSNPAEEEAGDALFDRVWDRLGDVLRMPAPDAAALATQMLLAARMADDDRLGFEDAGRVCHFLHNGLEAASQVRNLRNALRLGGMDHACLNPALDEFNAQTWFDAYRAAGGRTSWNNGALVLEVPEDDTATGALRASLDEDWKYRALALAAEQRLTTGGDDLTDHRGCWGRADGRAYAAPFDGTVKVADVVEFEGRPTGGTPIAHVRRVDNRGRA